MRRPLLALAFITALVAAAACSGGGGADATPSPTPSATVTSSPTPIPSPTPATGDLLVHVGCQGLACISGKLRTFVFDCASPVPNLAVATSGHVAMSETTSILVSFTSLPAPEDDCVRAEVDDTTGNAATPNLTSSITTVNGTSEDVDVILDDYAS